LRDAVPGAGREEFTEDIVNAGGGGEVLGEEGRESCGEVVGLEEWIVLTSVEEAEGGVMLGAEHAAEAAVGEGELAEVGGGGFRAFRGHFVCP
jgi:hypothetical protein